MGGNDELGGGKMIGVGECSDGGIDGLDIVVVVEKVWKVWRKGEVFDCG